MSHEQPRWRFARMTPAEINQDPVQGEFFSREADLPGRLVREAIQNSLDARRERETVRVRFVFSGERNALSPAKAQRYLDGLEEHVGAVVGSGGMARQSDVSEEGEAEAAYDALASFSAPMEYLVIEDFGTTGLRGKIGANSEREPGNDFWGFFRSIGISPKGQNAAGSWGLGKWVFPDASIVNAYLGMTQRVGEDNWLLMGMALLKTHHLGDVKYRYYGSFAAHSEEPDEQWLPLPVDSDDFVQDAVSDFNLERLEDPGLSVIVPYPKADLKPAEIARAVLTQYFLPIVRGDLVVEVVHPEAGNRTIDATTVEHEVAEIGESNRDDETADSMAGVLALTQWAITERSGEPIEIEASKVTAGLNDLDLDALRQRYMGGERLAFRLLTTTRRQGQSSSEAQPASFDVYLERAGELGEGHDYFVRGHLRVPKMDHIKRQTARALVLVDGESELGHLLRDAEGPAHERWDPFAQRLTERWVGGQTRVNQVRRATVELLQRLTERPAERQMDALADLFPGDPSRIGQGSSSRSGGGKAHVPDPPSIKPGTLQINAPVGAIVVRPAPRSESIPTGTVWGIRFAYDTVRGNPFRAFERGVKQRAPDFSLINGDLHIVSEGCEAETVDDNTVRLTTASPDFRLTVSGFDERDVKVEIHETEEMAGESEEEAA